MNGPREEILVVDDDAEFRRALRSRLVRRGFAVREAGDGQAALAAAREGTSALLLLDLRMPRLDGIAVVRELRRKQPELPIIVLTGHGSIDSAVEAMKLGAVDYLTKPCPPEDLDRAVDRSLERVRCRILPADPTRPMLVGASAAIARVRDRVDRVAATDSAVLVTGESGTGKEVVSRLLHASSPRRDGPFVVVDASAIPENLLEAELFGHVRGAFTGAEGPRSGLFEAADGGTLFLDEIGEMPLGLQAKLLRVLEDGSFRPIGSTASRTSSARVVSATNRDLRRLVGQGGFRSDLLYRLEVFTIRLPSLAERTGDVPLLARHRLAEVGRRTGRRLQLEDEALRYLEGLAWPGNVRELFHVIDEAAIVAPGPRIGIEHLPARVRQVSDPAPSGEAGTLAELGRVRMENALSDAGGNRTAAARVLGISVRTLQRKLRRWKEDEAGRHE